LTPNTFVKEQVAGRYAKNAIALTRLGNRTQSNNGMQRTRNKHASYHQAFVRAADAGRYAASLMNHADNQGI
jgi:hypothetical protein